LSVHCIVPGGGLSFHGTRRISSREKFFIPVKVLSRKYRGKFLAFLKEAYQDGELRFCGKLKPLSGKLKFQNLVDALYQKDWVVYCKKPFKSPWHVLRYLGRYTHRVAISNQRIVNLQDDRVTFTWRDYKDEGKTTIGLIPKAWSGIILKVVPKLLPLSVFGFQSGHGSRYWPSLRVFQLTFPAYATFSS